MMWLVAIERCAVDGLSYIVVDLNKRFAVGGIHSDDVDLS